MRKKLTKLFIALSLLPTLAFADVPVNIIPNQHYTDNTLTENTILKLVTETINLKDDKNIYKVKVQTIYNPETKKPDHLLVYLLSAKNYSLTITKIQLDANLAKRNVTENYQMNSLDKSQQPKVVLADIECPSPNVEMVSATPAYDIPTAVAAVKNVNREAQAYGYNSNKMIGKQATVSSYVNYLTCPKLKGFYNIGHGFNQGIILDDGVLTNDIITKDLKGKLNEKAIVVFNSCEVFRDPLLSSVVNDLDVQKYAGGISPLYIGPSEQSSQCFWNSALSRHPLMSSVEYCNKHFDPQDTWGIDGKGKDVMYLPNPA